MSSRVWREDDRPLTALVKRYAPVTTRRSAGPRGREGARDDRDAAGRAPCAPGPAAPAGPHCAWPRNASPAAVLQAIDVARAAARRVGELDGLGDGVFLLTAEELVHGAPPADAIAYRGELRAAHQRVRLVTAVWRGLPEVITDAPATDTPAADAEATAAARPVVSGTGLSAGVVEGTVRVVTDPSPPPARPAAGRAA